jgi:hypothetical protein
MLNIDTITNNAYVRMDQVCSILITNLVRKRIMNTCTKLKLDNKVNSKIKVDNMDLSYEKKRWEE